MAERPPIYLDYPATAPIDPLVLECVRKNWERGFGNPHADHHAAGWRSRRVLDRARHDLARFIAARASEIVFTSGATESNNLAILGTVLAGGASRGHAVTCVTEHASVLACFRHFERLGGRVTFLPVDPSGLIDLEELDAALEDDTRLVSIMAANSETGVVQPVADIAALCRSRGVPFHCDAAQAVGKMPLDVAAPGADLVSLSSHKMYGPVGVGALFVRSGVALEARAFGGGQESGLRSGTVPWPLCAGFGEAARIALGAMAAERDRLTELERRLVARLTDGLDGVSINGAGAPRLPGYLNVTVAGLDARALLLATPELALSTGSACGASRPGPSPVLKAMGLDDAEAHATIRIGLGRFTSEDDVEYAASRLIAGIRAQRRG